MTPEELGKIVRNLRGDMSLRDFANKCGVSHTTIDNIEKGVDFRTGKPTQVKMGTLLKIAEANKIPFSYLMKDAHLTEETPLDLPTNVHSIKTQSLPIFNDPHLPHDMGFAIKRANASPFDGFSAHLKVSNAQPIFADDTYESFTDASTDIEADFCLVAQDDSMIGARIQAGDVVFIRSQETIENGKIAAVTIDGVATLKRWNYKPEKAQLTLYSENSAYEPLVYVGEELNSVRCLGLAVCFMSNL